MSVLIIPTLVVQTAAQWAVDATIYPEYKILVTSDSLYTGTNVRKFKIADGILAWSALDYFPDVNALIAAIGLPQVLAINSSTNDLRITSNDLDSYIDLINNSIGIWLDKGATYAGIDFTTTFLDLQHSDRLILNAPQVRLQQLTALRILATDGSKDIQALDTATYPSLTELSYLKGITSAIQTQLNAKQSASAILSSLVTLGATAFGTTAGTFAQGNDSRFTDARNRKIYSYDNADHTVTGTVSETILTTVAFPLLGANDRAMIQCRLGAIGTAAVKAYRLYIGPNSGSLSGATQIALSNFANTSLSGACDRRFVNKGAVNSNAIYPATVTGGTDTAVSTTARTVLNIDTSVQQYIMVTCTLSNTGDTGRCEDIQIFWDVV